MPKLLHDTQRSIQHLFEIAEPRRIILHTAPYDLMGLFHAVGMRDLARAGHRTRRLLVSEEVMAQTIKHRFGSVADIGP